MSLLKREAEWPECRTRNENGIGAKQERLRVVPGARATLLRPRLPALPTRLRPITKLHLRPLLHAPCHHRRIPIRQPHAAVGLGFADVGGGWRAVQAIAVAKADPGGAHGVVGAGADGEGSLRPHAFEFVGGVVAPGRVGLHLRHLQRAARRRRVRAADAGGQGGQQLARGGEELHLLRRLVHLDAADLEFDVAPLHVDVGHRDGVAGAVKSFARVQRRQQRLAHVEFFRQGFARAGVAKRLEVFHGLQLARQLVEKRPGHISGGEGVVDDRRRLAGRGQRAPDRVERLRRQRLGLQALHPREGGERLARIVAQLAVDLAGGNPRAVEPHLRLHHRGVDGVLRGQFAWRCRGVDGRCVEFGRGFGGRMGWHKPREHQQYCKTTAAHLHRPRLPAHSNKAYASPKFPLFVWGPRPDGHRFYAYCRMNLSPAGADNMRASEWLGFPAKHAPGLDPGVETGSAHGAPVGWRFRLPGAARPHPVSEPQRSAAIFETHF